MTEFKQKTNLYVIVKPTGLPSDFITSHLYGDCPTDKPAVLQEPKETDIPRNSCSKSWEASVDLV